MYVNVSRPVSASIDLQTFAPDFTHAHRKDTVNLGPRADDALSHADDRVQVIACVIAADDRRGDRVQAIARGGAVIACR